MSRLAEEGTVLLAGRTQHADPSSFGLVILETETEADAQRIMEDDPAVRSGVMDAELFPYQIAIVGRGIETKERNR